MEIVCIKANHAVLIVFTNFGIVSLLMDHDAPFTTETKEKLKAFWIKNALPEIKSR